MVLAVPITSRTQTPQNMHQFLNQIQRQHITDNEKHQIYSRLKSCLRSNHHVMYLYLSIIHAGLFELGHSRLYELNAESVFEKSVPLAHSTFIELNVNGVTGFDSDGLVFQVHPLHQKNNSIIYQDLDTNSVPIHDNWAITNEGYHDISLNAIVSGTIKISNDYGCLNGNEFSKKSLLAFLSVVMVISTILYIESLRRNDDYAIKHHIALLILSIVASLELVIHYISVEYTNTNCVDNGFLQFVTVLLKTCKDVGFVMISIALCSGWGTMYKEWKNMFTKVAFIMFMPSYLTAYAIVTAVDINAPFSSIVRIGVIFRIGLQIGITVFIMISLRKLKNKYDDLVMFERVQIVMQCIGFIYTYHMWWSFDNNIAIHWRYDWIEIYGIWDVLYTILLLTMVFIWKSSQNNSNTNDHILKMEQVESIAINKKKEYLDFEIDSDVEIQELLQSATDLESDVNDLNDSLDEELGFLAL